MISVNDEYGNAELCAKRLEHVLEILGLVGSGDWKETRERELVVMSPYARSFERLYSSDLLPEDLKFLLKSGELVEMPEQFEGDLKETVTVANRKYVRLCDIDVLTKVRHLMLTTWDKIPFHTVLKMRGIDEKTALAASLEALDAELSKGPKAELEMIRTLELDIIASRFKK